MLKTSCFLMFSLVLLPFGAAAESYKCRAPDGKITYSGQVSLTPGVKCEPMFAKKQPVVQAESTLAVPAAAPDASGKPVEKSAADKALEAKRKKAETDETKKKAEGSAEDKLAAQKQKEENCQNAQANLKTYQMGGRISKINDKGEKEYLNDAEIKQKTEQAQKDVEKWCGA